MMTIDHHFRIRCFHNDVSLRLYKAQNPPRAMRYQTEAELRSALVQRLLASGIMLEANVRCEAGSADLVTSMRDIIIEVKYHLTRSALFGAIGQVLLYRQLLNPAARAIVVGYATIETDPLIPHAAALGVEIRCWYDDISTSAVEKRAMNQPFPMTSTERNGHDT